jgi:hypothetical protein
VFRIKLFQTPASLVHISKMQSSTSSAIYSTVVIYIKVFFGVSVLKKLYIVFVVQNAVCKLVCLNKFVVVCICGLKYVNVIHCL